MNVKRKLEVVSNERPEPPYPADVRAKGWHFELDIERIRQSEAWMKCKPRELRNCMLRVWMESWTQVPCGSLPDDDELIADHIDMDLELFVARRSVLMRGWYPASDGRLYHQTITERVEAMRDSRRADREKKAKQRAEKNQPLSGNVPGDTTGTPSGLHDESPGCPPTGSGSGPGSGSGSGSGTGGEAAAAGAAPPKPKVERGTRLPKDWLLPKPWGVWAVSQGYAEADIRTEATKFRNYWVAKSGKDATKLDWEATWQNWMLGSKAMRAGVQPGGAPITVPSAEADRTAAYLAERKRLEDEANSPTNKAAAAAALARMKGVPA